MKKLTRREILKIFSLLFPATIFRCREGDIFAKERVCVHVYSRGIAIPEPLVRSYRQIPVRRSHRSQFNIGIPEVMVCTTPISFLQLFPYFWPLSREEYRQSQVHARVNFQRAFIQGKDDIAEIREHLNEISGTQSSSREITALTIVLNDDTRYWIAELIGLWQQSSLDEVVIFKDPGRSPYLCDYPALQAGFRRPPP